MKVVVEKPTHGLRVKINGKSLIFKVRANKNTKKINSSSKVNLFFEQMHNVYLETISNLLYYIMHRSNGFNKPNVCAYIFTVKDYSSIATDQTT